MGAVAQGGGRLPDSRELVARHLDRSTAVIDRSLYPAPRARTDRAWLQRCGYHARHHDGAIDEIRMKAISPLADFSFDYHDLLFRPDKPHEH